MILSIESSCDESALALFDPGRGLVGEWVHTQIELHRLYGGVVPELAVREHERNFPLLMEAAGPEIEWPEVREIAVTTGPGLAGCLALGLSLAKSIALQHGLPLHGINHLRGHAWSPFLPAHASDPARFAAGCAALLPHLGLIASGGNTLLFRIDPGPRLSLLAETVDDAAGEALDKGAKLLGFPYPGGPLIERWAKDGDPARFPFPRSSPGRDDWRFSFSGLKTSLRYLLEKMDGEEVQRSLPDLCAGYQKAVVGALVHKTAQALDRMGPFCSLGVSGGVSHNRSLVDGLQTLARTHRIPFLPALPQHRGDNAAMIGFASWVDPLARRPNPAWQLGIDPSWPLI